MNLLLPQIYPIEHPEDYKLHLACRSGREDPLDLFVHHPEKWESWNKWKKSQNHFNRGFIFSLIDFWPEQERWLFGGAWQVHGSKYKDHWWEYDITLVEACKPFIGRLKLSLKRPGRVKAVYLEKYYSKLVVTEILPTRYAGEVFCGFDNIDIEFWRLEDIIRRQQSDWKASLESVKGVYLITDIRNGKRYVGSAYGRGGIWSRWECYTGTGHGHTDELTKIISKRGLEYARESFHFALLEHFSTKTDKDFVTGRETYWKNVLRSRGKYGYNKN
jgi:hypothetical protein